MIQVYTVNAKNAGTVWGEEDCALCFGIALSLETSVVHQVPGRNVRNRSARHSSLRLWPELIWGGAGTGRMGLGADVSLGAQVQPGQQRKTLSQMNSKLTLYVPGSQ